MRPLFFLFVIILCSCIGETAEEKFFRECPYKTEYSVAAHQLRVPVHVIPHQVKYKVGDTISFVVDMSDSIFDINTEQTFKISDFPFKPVAVLYHFYEDLKWKDGFLQVQHKIDTSNFIGFAGNGPHPQIAFLKYKFFESKYHLSIQLVLTRKGRYIFQLGDNVDLLDMKSEEYKQINAITFDGKCPTFGFWPVNMIVGDDQMAYFEKELLYIDKEEFYDNWKTTKEKVWWKSPYGTGSFFWEYNATFGFEVE